MLCYSYIIFLIHISTSPITHPLVLVFSLNLWTHPNIFSPSLLHTDCSLPETLPLVSVLATSFTSFKSLLKVSSHEGYSTNLSILLSSKALPPSRMLHNSLIYLAYCASPTPNAFTLNKWKLHKGRDLFIHSASRFMEGAQQTVLIVEWINEWGSK